MFVIDASVFAKAIKDEEDSSLARESLASAVETATTLIAPRLVVYELLGIALHHEIPPAAFLDLLDTMAEGGLRIVDPDRQTLLRAAEMAIDVPSIGRVTLQDAVYHALAIEVGAVLVTADFRHFRRSSHYGHVCLLPDWRP